MTEQEKNKTEKTVNEIVLTNLPDKEFKAMVLKILD